MFFLATNFKRARFRFAPAYQAFDRPDLVDIRFACLLGSQRIENLLFDRSRLLIVDIENSVVLGHHVSNAMSIMIKNSDIATGHVGDVRLMSVVDKPDQGTTHTDDIVIGMRTETNDLFGIATPRMVLNGVHEPAENSMRYPLGGTMMTQQLMKIVFAEIVIVQFEQRLARLFT